MDQCTFESFQKNVEKHVLTVKMDNGLFRHFTVKSPGTTDMHYNITTWPGYLCYSGDMGCFVFERNSDMIAFFRNHPGHISPHYWAEKVEAAGIDCVKVFDISKFKNAVNAVFKDWLEGVSKTDDGDIDEELQELIDEEKSKIDDLIDEASENEHHAVVAINNFDNVDGGVRFDDFWENDLTTFSYRYIWCCYAIVHAISLYDAIQTEQVSPDQSTLE